MWVCLCCQMKESDVREAIHEKGCHSIRDLGNETGLGRQCGRCIPLARSIIRYECAHSAIPFCDKEQSPKQAQCCDRESDNTILIPIKAV